MAVARLDTATVTASVTTATYTVSAGANRMLVVAVSWEVDGAITIDAITYGGQSMVEAVEIVTPDAGFAAGCAIYYILEAGIAAASSTTISATYSSAPAEGNINAASYTGVNQTGGATTNPATASAESNETTPNPLLPDLTETDEGMVSAVNSNGNASTVTWGTDMTEQTDNATASANGSYADRLSTTNANVNIEPTNASQNRASACSASFAPSALTYEQEGFRWRNDDGSESAATWRQAQDVDDSIGKEENIRVRVLSDSAGADPPTATASLQYKRDDEAAAEWRDV